jgi:hypothetical protein
MDCGGGLPDRPGPAGFDEHQVRTWTSWHRWVTLAMLVLAFLTIAALAEHAHRPPPAMVPLTRNQIARAPRRPAGRPGNEIRYRLRWSAWRRRHQRTAQACPTSGKPLITHCKPLITH